MTDSFRRAGLITAIALVGTAACGRNSGGSRAMDDGLRSDLEQAGASGLELAPKAGRQVVVSAIEGGPQAAPTSARRTRPPVRQAVQRPVQQPIQQPRRQTVVARRATPATPAPATSRVEAEAPAPKPTPAPQPQAQQRQPGVYSTEADVFRQMPWIRP